MNGLEESCQKIGDWHQMSKMYKVFLFVCFESRGVGFVGYLLNYVSDFLVIIFEFVILKI